MAHVPQVPLPLMDTVHRTRVRDVLHLDFIFLGGSDITQDTDELDGYKHMLVMLEGASGSYG